MQLLPTRRVVVLGVLAAVALAFYPGGPVDVWVAAAVITGGLVLVALLDAFVGTSPGVLLLRREHPPVVVAGGKATITWEVRSESRRSLRVAVADDLAPSLRARTRRFSVKLPPGGSATVSSTVHPLRRGRFALDHLTVRIDGRLGIGSRQVRVPISTVLRVHPPFRSRQQAELKLRRARVLEIGLRTARGLGGGTEFEQLREYGPDDEFRRIDWTATARAGRTIVRTYRAERNQSVLLLLDNGRTMAGRVGGVPRVEHAMDAAMMLSTVAVGLGDRCGLVAFDRSVRQVVPIARRVDQVGRITEGMYDLEPELTESDYATAFARVVTVARRRALLVLMTDLVDQAVDEALLPALPMLTRTHLVVIGSVRDPQVEAWASGGVDDGVDPEAAAFRQASAIQTLSDRRRVAARLRGMGATVVDATPGRFASELTDVYLSAKSTGRL